MSVYALSAHTCSCFPMKLTVEDSSNGTRPVLLCFHKFTQIGVKEKAVALIINSCRSVQVIREEGEMINILPHFVEMPKIPDSTQLKEYLSQSVKKLIQLSDKSYKLSTHPRVDGGGAAHGKLTKAQLTHEEHKMLKVYLLQHKSPEEGLEQSLKDENQLMIKIFLKAGVKLTIVSQEEKIKFATLDKWVKGNLEERETAKLLIEAGAIEKESDVRKCTLLVDAMEMDDEPLAGAIINTGFDVNLQAANKEPNLHIALSKKLKRAAVALIKAKADVNALNSKGVSPLVSLYNAREDWKNKIDLREVIDALEEAKATFGNDDAFLNYIIELRMNYYRKSIPSSRHSF